jgi:hypothetical protein
VRDAAALALLFVLASCGDSAPTSRGSTSRPSWTVETVLFRDTYAEADGYAVTADPRGFVVVTKNGREAVRYVGVGAEVVRVTREE